MIDNEANGKKIVIISSSKINPTELKVDEEKGKMLDDEDDDSSTEQSKLSDVKEIKKTINAFTHLKEDLVIFKNPYYYLILLVEIVFFFCFLSFMIIMQNLPGKYIFSRTVKFLDSLWCL